MEELEDLKELKFFSSSFVYFVTTSDKKYLSISILAVSKWSFVKCNICYNLVDIPVEAVIQNWV